jgi:Na+-transporting NADH:ubiquinone oxidoreductase subunit NqrB
VSVFKVACPLFTIAHGVSRLAITSAQHQSTKGAFWSGFVSSGFATPKSMGFVAGTAVTAVVAGKVSEFTGGNFANGAMSGAFIHMFNGWGKDLGTDISDAVSGRIVDKNLHMEPKGKRIMSKGLTGMALGAANGTSYGIVAGPAGVAIGMFIGGTLGLASGLLTGVGLEIAGWGEAVSEIEDTIIGTGAGWIEHAWD